MTFFSWKADCMIMCSLLRPFAFFRGRWYMRLEQWWNEISRGRPEEREKSLLQCQFINHELHMNSAAIEPLPVRWQASLAADGTDSVGSAPSMCNVFRCSFIINYFTTCFGLNGHLQAYRLLHFRTLLLTAMRFSLSCCYSYSYFG
jgi:hypothetical protein